MRDPDRAIMLNRAVGLIGMEYMKKSCIAPEEPGLCSPHRVLV